MSEQQALTAEGLPEVAWTRRAGREMVLQRIVVALLASAVAEGERTKGRDELLLAGERRLEEAKEG